VPPRRRTSSATRCASSGRAGLIHTRTLPAAVELLTGPGWENDPAIGPKSEPNEVGRVSNPSYPLRLVVGLEGSSAEVEWMTAQLQEEWRRAGVVSPVTLAGSRADPLWDRLTESSSGSTHTSGDRPLIVQIHVLPGDVVSLVRRLRELDPEGSIQAHAGSGIVLARLCVGAKEAAAMVDQRLRPEVLSIGGSMVVLAQPEGAELSPQTLFGPAPEGWAVMQSIQRQFDPKGILNRGRFLFAPSA